MVDTQKYLLVNTLFLPLSSSQVPSDLQDRQIGQKIPIKNFILTVIIAKRRITK